MTTPKPCNILGVQQQFELHLNRVFSCCRAHPMPLDDTKSLTYYHDIWAEKKQKLEQGIEIIECEYCWKAERAGQTSYRMIWLENNTVKDIDIFFSSLCNQMCSYCSPKYSSVWNDSIVTDGMFSSISSTAKTNLQPTQVESVNSDHWLTQIHNDINLSPDNSVIVNLLGGEPLMQVNNLKKILESNYEKIKKLKITTNLNPPSNKFLCWLLETAPAEKLFFDISLDATPEYNHLPRGLFDFKKFNENLDLLKKHNIQYTIKSHLSVLNIFDIKNFLNWLTLTDSPVNFANLNNPECLYPLLIPTKFRKKIWDDLSGYSVPPLVKEALLTEIQLVDIKLFEQYNYLSQYFARTNIDPLQVDNALFVEYWAWLTDQYKK
jgi:organic radical activating enzyme